MSAVTAGRDTDATPFTQILERFLMRVPGAAGAAVVDVEGETVDYAGRLDPFDLRIAAAHARILLLEIERFGKLGSPRALVVRGSAKGIVARALDDGYALVVLLAPWAAFAVPARALAVCERELAEEAGLSGAISEATRSAALRGGPYPVDVDVDARGRPTRVRARAGAHTGATIAVDVLGALRADSRDDFRSTGGAVATPSAPAHGYRVRTEHGHEVTLTREARRFWYADEPLEREPR